MKPALVKYASRVSFADTKKQKRLISKKLILIKKVQSFLLDYTFSDTISLFI